jgi:hypothetical protein
LLVAAKTNNVDNIMFDHRTSDPYNDYDYDVDRTDQVKNRDWLRSGEARLYLYLLLTDTKKIKATRSR